ncbi:hypothetical protein ABFT43_10005 [Gordonia sp. B21]|uniref:hypothetical protein n=1 Tax=Gordonia sp. B21 TaxID=3151852 RepID=UPI003265E3A8
METDEQAFAVVGDALIDRTANRSAPSRTSSTPGCLVATSATTVSAKRGCMSVATRAKTSIRGSSRLTPMDASTGPVGSCRVPSARSGRCPPNQVSMSCFTRSRTASGPISSAATIGHQSGCGRPVSARNAGAGIDQCSRSVRSTSPAITPARLGGSSRMSRPSAVDLQPSSTSRRGSSTGQATVTRTPPGRPARIANRRSFAISADGVMKTIWQSPSVASRRASRASNSRQAFSTALSRPGPSTDG